jgi:DNA-binding transcriptional MerR regulator
MKRLREVCNIIGVDRHVLQRIGTAKGQKEPLLPPTLIDETSGYWYYDDAAIEKLWLIKLFRELGCTFRQIQEIFNSPDFDQREWFGKQIELLEKKKEHIDKLIHVAEIIHTSGMLPTEIDNVKDYSIDEYLEYTKNKFDSINKENMQRVSKIFGNSNFNNVLNKIYATWQAGAHPQDTEVQNLVKNAYQIFNTIAKTTSSNGFEMFGKMMISNGVFSFKMDETKGKGSSKFVGEAITIYLKKVGGYR